MNPSEYLKNRTASKVYMWVFRVASIVTLLPPIAIHYGLFSPTGIEYVLTAVVVSLAAMVGLGSLYKYWTHKQEQTQALE